MKILIGCEMSGIIREAFRKRGNEAYSCDLIPSLDNSPFHMQRDIFEVLESIKPDLTILNPPCTAMTLSGNGTYAKGKARHPERGKALIWTKRLWELAKKKSKSVCLENPVGCLPHAIGVYSQIIHPWQYGHGEQKKTCLWLHNLPPLIPTNIVEGREQRIWKMGPSKDRAMIRSLTYQGWADAMAAQWG